MKRLSLTLVTLAALTVAGSALAESDMVANDIMGLQLNPVMHDAFHQGHNQITIQQHPFVVVAPATCAATHCTVILDYLNNDPKTFIVLHEKAEGDETLLKAKVITIFPQQLYQLSYNAPTLNHTALTVTDIHRIYR